MSGCLITYTILQIPWITLHAYKRSHIMPPKPCNQTFARAMEATTTIVFIDGIIIAGPLPFSCNHMKTESLQTRRNAQSNA